ncbi:MAG: hypothetical protein ACEQR5_07170 [Moraxellaceae bacterium]
MNKILTTFLMLFISIPFYFGQYFNTQRNWSMNKKELVFGLGATGFLGDLGGADKIGTDYSLKDYDFNSTNIGGSIGFRYRFHPYYSTTSILNFGMIKGSDSYTKEPVRFDRNLHFRSPVLNFSQRFEFILFANEKFGRRYKIPGLKGFREKNEQFYLFSGIGVMLFNPQAQYNGEWYNLHDLKTEGQGLPGGATPYKRVTATIPIGFGMRMGISRYWRIGIEVSYIKTFSDYIDDVHGVYYDPAVLLTQVGPAAAALSNPATTPSWFEPGSQRGDKQLDGLLYVNFTLTKNITFHQVGTKRLRYKQAKLRSKF